MSNKFDVVVVGSGPAGATYARIIKEAQPTARVLMVEAGPVVPNPAGRHVRTIKDPMERVATQFASQDPEANPADYDEPAGETGFRPPPRPATSAAWARTGPVPARGPAWGRRAPTWTRRCSTGPCRTPAGCCWSPSTPSTVRRSARRSANCSAPTTTGAAAPIGSCSRCRWPWTCCPAVSGTGPDPAPFWVTCWRPGGRTSSCARRPSPSASCAPTAAPTACCCTIGGRTGNARWVPASSLWPPTRCARRSCCPLPDIRPTALGHYLNEHTLTTSTIQLDPALRAAAEGAHKTSEGAVDLLAGVNWVPYDHETFPFHGQVTQWDASPIPVDETFEAWPFRRRVLAVVGAHDLAGAACETGRSVLDHPTTIGGSSCLTGY